MTASQQADERDRDGAIGGAGERPADLPGIGVPAEALAGGNGDDGTLHQCDGCQALWPTVELREPRRSPEAADEDGAAPTGECPACGGACFPADEIDGLSAAGRAGRVGAEMGGAIAGRPVVPATSGPCDVPGSEQPSAAGVSDPEGIVDGTTEWPDGRLERSR